MVAVVVTPDARLEAAELIAHCEAKLAYFAVPRYVRVVPALPKTASERVQKFKLREQGVTADTFDRGQIRRPGSAQPPVAPLELSMTPVRRTCGSRSDRCARPRPPSAPSR